MKQMKENIKYAHLRVAEEYAKLSYCVRLKVGALIVTQDDLLLLGYNGTPCGWKNICEIDGVTKPEVLHAESNAITKLAKSHASGKGASMFTTTAPCIECAKLIHQTGITHIYYRNIYRSDEGIKFLEKCDGIHIERLLENA